MQTSAERGSNEASNHRPSDRDLLSRFLTSRDESAFAEIVTRYSRLVMSVALHTLRDPHAAEDAFQAAFLVLARSARKIQNRDSLASWLHGTTFRVSQRLLRTRLRRKEQDLPSVELPAPIWATPTRPDEQAALDEELARLSETLRGPLVLHYLEGRTVPEIAAELKMTQSAVEGRLKRGKKTLRKRLLRRGVLLSSAVFGAGLTVPAQATVATTLVTATVAACLKATTSATLAPMTASLVQQIALQETAAMTRLALLKTALVCGGVAGAIGLAGAGANGTLDSAWATAATEPSAVPRGPQFDASEAVMPPTGVIQTALMQLPAESPNVLIKTGQGDFAADKLEIDLTTAKQPPEATSGRDRNSPDVDTAPVASNDSPRLNLAGQDEARELKVLQQHIDQQRQIIEALKAQIEKLARPAVDEFSPRPTAPKLKPLDDLLKGDNRKPYLNSIFAVRPDSPNEERILTALDRSVDFQFTGQTLQEVMNYLAAQENIVIRLDTTSLSEAGVGPDQEINLIVSGISLKSALNLMFKDVGGTQLDYLIEDEVMKITTRVKADETLQTVIYDASALGVEDAQQLMQVIQQTVEPQSWSTASLIPGLGGGFGPAAAGEKQPRGEGTIVPYGNSVIVTTSRRLHDKTAEILELLDKHAKAARLNQ